MEIIRHIPGLKRRIHQWKRTGYQIGFVPTMGALHHGHLKLIKQSVKETDKTVVSIFVNPFQFGPQEDFTRYPRPFLKDIKLCRREGVDLIFYPESSQMYQPGFKTFVDLPADEAGMSAKGRSTPVKRSASGGKGLTRMLCGRSRPGHFRGVMTVVIKLFNLVEPDIAYFGQKDYQQALIIQQMVRDLNMNLRVKVLPTVRDKDGLAISSRNVYLSPRQRQEATCLWRALVRAQKVIKSGETSVTKIINQMRKIIKQVKSSRIDYIAIVDAQTLQPLKRIRSRRGALIALAVYIGKTRLIDNVVIKRLKIFS